MKTNSNFSNSHQSQRAVSRHLVANSFRNLVMSSLLTMMFLVLFITVSSAQSRSYSYPKWAGAIVDNCVTWATTCNGGGAHNFCRLKGYNRASRWSIYRPGRTYVIGSKKYCNGGGCGGYSSITCTGGGSYGGGGGGANNPFCRNYANTAIKQNRRNLNLGCGFGGSRWQSNFNLHYSWCKRVARSSANSERMVRRRKLNRCY